jgi:iron complex transport system ATP-binding protein
VQKRKMSMFDASRAGRPRPVEAGPPYPGESVAMKSQASDPEPLLTLEDVSFSYPSGFALRNVSLTVSRRAFLGLVGPNGSGKTTLFRLMTGLLRPAGGEVTLLGRPLREYSPGSLARVMAVASSDQGLDFPFLAEDVVAMGRYAYLGRIGGMSAEDHRIVDETLALTETAHLRRRQISQLSSGERQRVLIARCLVQLPSILLLDEPDAHLDVHHQARIFQLLLRLNSERGIGIVAILHDLTLAAGFCDSIALLSRGSLMSVGKPSDVITDERVRTVYGEGVRIQADPTDGLPIVSYLRGGALRKEL